MFTGPVHVTGFYTLDQTGPFILLFKKKKSENVQNKGKILSLSLKWGTRNDSLISFM